MPMGQMSVAPGAVVVRRPRARRVKGKALNKQQKKQVKSLISKVQELKFAHFTFSGTVSSTGFVVGCADIPQGDDQNQRDGDRVQWSGTTELRLMVQNGFGGVLPDAFNNIRIILFQWKPASTPTIENILSPGPFTTYDYLSPYNHNTRQQYQILFDKVYNTHLGTTDFPDSFTIVRSIRVPLKRVAHYTEYTPSGSLFGTNRFYLMAFSDSDAPTHPSLSISVKTYFRDS